jgi:hypothetical protein
LAKVQDFEFRAAFSPFVVNRASIVLAQQQLLLKMEHALTPVLEKIFKPLMLKYFGDLPNSIKKCHKNEEFLN